MSISSMKVALVTASSSGLGAAAAKALAIAGFRIAVNYNAHKENADALVQEILQAKLHLTDLEKPITGRSECVAFKGDMSQREDIKILVEKTVEVMGRIDVIVSNQGWTRLRQFEDLDDNMDDSDWDNCFNMNVKSHLWLFHAAKPHLAATQGAFITIASLAGVVPNGSSIPYAVTKAAQIHLVKSLARISGPENIRVNSISPGVLMTDWGKKFSPIKMKTATEKSVLKRLADVDDAAQQVVYYATTRSSTGQNAIMDAGYLLG